MLLEKLIKKEECKILIKQCCQIVLVQLQENMMGTTTVTSYVESGSGVKAGGRTGMTSLVIGVLFLACLFFAPLATSLPKEIDGGCLTLRFNLICEKHYRYRME